MSKSEQSQGSKAVTRKSNTEFIVTEPGGLLDFLLRNISNQSRNNIKSMLKHREVLVNGSVVTKYDYALRTGQKIRINQSKDRGQSRNRIPPIVYEDDEFLVIDKPAGLLSIATDKEREQTAYHLMTEYMLRKNHKGRIFIVHRIDCNTSGILLFAKNERIKLALQNNWSDLVFQRRYVAVVEGRPKDKSGRIQSWLKQTKTLLMYSTNQPDGLEAITNYQVIKESDEHSLVDIGLETGRKNQIRVHMKELGHPVVGDKKYGAKTDPLKRLGLHAYKLEFAHPFSHKMMCFEAQTPKKFLALFEK